MKRKNGFTLVELLAAITIMSILLILLLTISGNIRKNAAIGVYNEKIKSIEIAAAAWGQDHSELVTETSGCPDPKNFDNSFSYTCYTELTVQRLIEENYLKADASDGKLLDPRDKNNTLNNYEIIVYHYYSNYYAVIMPKDYVSSIDNKPVPTITFSPNGNKEPAKIKQSTVVSVSGTEGPYTLNYVWSTSNNVSAAASTSTFTSGQTITKSDGTGEFYLCIYVADKNGHHYDVCSESFYINVIFDAEFAYTGAVQSFTAEKSSYYKIELWGAQGGSYSSTPGGNGAYTNGTIYLTEGETILMYIGQKGIGGAVGTGTTGYGAGGAATWNGGAAAGRGGGNATYPATNYGGGASGGGATDIRLTSGAWNDVASLRSRIMVAAGGGGNGRGSATNASYPLLTSSGGGLIGQEGNITASYYDITFPLRGFGGTQVAGGAGYSAGSFGIGGAGAPTGQPSGICNGQGGGGGGYYGGGGGKSNTTSSCVTSGGGGGSSFISGYAGVNAVTSAASTVATNNTNHYSGKYFIDTQMISGNEVMPNPNGGTMTGNTGNGYAKITYFGENPPERVHKKLDNVRYIKSCIKGNSINYGNHWVELQAIKDGVNIAKGKTVTGTVAQNASYPYTRITDGIIDTASYAATSDSTVQFRCVTIDLGNIYDLDEVALWLYSADRRAYYDNILSVGDTNTSGTTSLSVILHDYSGTPGYYEAPEGKHYNAWNLIPDIAKLYAYTGNSQIINDGNGNWRIKFLTSGTLTMYSNTSMDIFLVGGGTSGGGWNSSDSGPGGGGGYTTTKKNIAVTANTNYTITIGAGGAATQTQAPNVGGATSGFGYSAAGGKRNTSNSAWGGFGGSGGAAPGVQTKYGGTNGANGASNPDSTSGTTHGGGTGQGTTTREFGETSGTLYSKGGDSLRTEQTGTAGAANTGNGGNGGGSGPGGAGGSGIVIIRNAR